MKKIIPQNFKNINHIQYEDAKNKILYYNGDIDTNKPVDYTINLIKILIEIDLNIKSENEKIDILKDLVLNQ